MHNKVNNHVVHGFQGFTKLAIINAVMFIFSKATDEISCFSMFGHCDYQESMPCINQLTIFSSEDDIGNFVVSLDKQEIVTAQLWL